MPYHPPIADTVFTQHGATYRRIHYPGRVSYYKLVKTYKGKHWRWLGDIETTS